MEKISNNLQDTKQIAFDFEKGLVGGEVITLSGDLGAGKTTFTQSLAKAMGIDEPITSPTFTLMNQYQGKKLKLYHFDMYRIEDIDEILETGLTEYFGNTDAVCVIEWAENISMLLPKNKIEIKIEKLGENSRKFVFKH
ncbi:MAG: tRNA (adenosine(37)-N6)-threonylcarbamoyltransferase complex ATPase subunit type 1 TsaE [Clostridia bacterium]|nr:tRNA (adenosine(37)-N6)-threonylcarbamoyltransferase complex ATPase subunit type 1 TsaE [Clostridia bacterium]